MSARLKPAFFAGRLRCFRPPVTWAEKARPVFRLGPPSITAGKAMTLSSLPTTIQRAAIATCSRKAFDGRLKFRRRGIGVIEYRVYFVGHDGHFVKFEALSCADDAEAIAQAKRLVADQDLELWSGGRFIVRLTPPE